MRDKRCVECGQRTAKSCYKGHWCFREDHDLCEACWNKAGSRLAAENVIPGHSPHERKQQRKARYQEVKLLAAGDQEPKCLPST